MVRPRVRTGCYAVVAGTSVRPTALRLSGATATRRTTTATTSASASPEPFHKADGSPPNRARKGAGAPQASAGRNKKVRIEGVRRSKIKMNKAISHTVGDDVLSAVDPVPGIRTC